MNGNYFVQVGEDEDSWIFLPDELADALAVFFTAIRDGAEHVELRWSA